MIHRIITPAILLASACAASRFAKRKSTPVTRADTERLKQELRKKLKWNDDCLVNVAKEPGKEHWRFATVVGVSEKFFMYQVDAYKLAEDRDGLMIGGESDKQHFCITDPHKICVDQEKIDAIEWIGDDSNGPNEVTVDTDHGVYSMRNDPLWIAHVKNNPEYRPRDPPVKRVRRRTRAESSSRDRTRRTSQSQTTQPSYPKTTRGSIETKETKNSRKSPYPRRRGTSTARKPYSRGSRNSRSRKSKAHTVPSRKCSNPEKGRPCDRKSGTNPKQPCDKQDVVKPDTTVEGLEDGMFKEGNKCTCTVTEDKNGRVRTKTYKNCTIYKVYADACRVWTNDRKLLRVSKNDIKDMKKCTGNTI